MSYILDALTKAAKQRERQVPVVQRLLSPPAPRAPWVRVPGRARAGVAAGGVLLAVLMVWWLRPVSSVSPPEPSFVMTAPAPVPAPKAVIVEPSPRVGRLEPLPRAVPVETPARREREAVVAPPVATARPAPLPAPGFRASVPLPQEATTAEVPAAGARPATPARPGAPVERSGLKLEALIYSDLPAQRMVFINGRRYAEGDVVDGRLRVEEIQEEGVELSDQGRRFTLRATR